MNTKLHAVADARGRPIGFFMSAGQVSDYTGAAALLGSLPNLNFEAMAMLVRVLPSTWGNDG